jgi:hypothetical protein
MKNKNKNPGFMKWGSRQWMREREQRKVFSRVERKWLKPFCKREKGLLKRVKTMSMKKNLKNTMIFVFVSVVLFCRV